MKNPLLMKMLLLIFITIASGCATSRIIPHSQGVLDADVTQVEKLSELSVFVHIDTSDKNKEWKTNQFIEALRKANIFSRIDSVANSDKYDIEITRFEHEYPLIDKGFQCFEPMLLVLSLGVIPSVCEGEHILSFNLQRLKGQEAIHIEEKFLQKSMAGWVGLPATAASKGWKFSGNFEEYLRFVFAAHADEIVGL